MRNSSSAILVSALHGGALLCGCAVGPDFTPPNPDMPPAWVGPVEADGSGPDMATWWTIFGDATLVSLEPEAIAPCIIACAARSI